MSLVKQIALRQAQAEMRQARLNKPSIDHAIDTLQAALPNKALTINAPCEQKPKRYRRGKIQRQHDKAVGGIIDPKYTVNVAYNRIYSPVNHCAEHASIRWHKVKVVDMPLPVSVVKEYRKLARQAGKHLGNTVRGLGNKVKL